jgi:hypothetical protein
MLSSHTGPFLGAPVRSLPGDIEYIDSPAGLEAESHTMLNCVGSYADRVARHECFIYSVLGLDRCTLAIELGASQRFHVRELKAQRNQLPSSPATRARVEQWLHANHDPESAERVRASRDAGTLGHHHRRAYALAPAWPARERDDDPMLYGDAHAIPF